MEFAQENVFWQKSTQKYRDISLMGGFLPHATLIT